MKYKRIQSILDKHFKRIIQHSSANWGGQVVWSVKSDGITDGIFIHQDDDNNFTLLIRSEENEETKTFDLFTYRIGSGELGRLINIAKALK